MSSRLSAYTQITYTPLTFTPQRHHQFRPFPSVQTAARLIDRLARQHPAHQRQHLRRQRHRTEPVVEERLAGERHPGPTVCRIASA